MSQPPHSHLDASADPLGDFPSGKRGWPLSWTIAAGTAGVLILGTALAVRSQLRQKSTSLADQAKGVGVIEVEETVFRMRHRYVGTVNPWIEAKVGPQFLSGYLTQVLVRPGDPVRRGQVLAILEPERAAAENTVTRMDVEALEARLAALARESERIQGLEKKGIVSQNEAEKKLAEVASEKARLSAAKARVTSTNLQFEDSTLRAPFDGEIGDRYLDPGAFVRPGSSILSVIDRTRVRVAADAPEGDYAFLAVGTPVHLNFLSKNQSLEAKVSRLSPAADAGTRTIHFELDLPNATRTLPVGTTAELQIEEREGRKVLQVPSSAATVRGDQATVYKVDGDHARKVVLPFLGERDGQLFLAAELPAGTKIVQEGRGQLQDGDRISFGTSGKTR
ncbi:MAG TPA: efflux RND transporter periplasmic adaptor subunit [Geothrix sp.]|nr:efflux RND transporter periplasmic adaptor subunit [Geothrix sp.]